MKRFLFGFLAILFLILNTIPYLHILADDMPTNSQYEMLGAYALSTLITSGEATELDFSDYTENDTSFLIDLGEAIFTGDWSGLAEDGLEWLGDTADFYIDSAKEYVAQWNHDNLGLLYTYSISSNELYYVGPNPDYSLARPLRDLLTPRDNSTPTPIPQPNNITTLLNYMNYRSTDHNAFYFYNIPETNPNTSIRSSFVGYYPVTNYSWFTPSSNNWDYVNGNISNHVSYPFNDIFTIDIIESNGIYSYSNNIYLSPNNVIKNGNNYWKALNIYNFNQSNMYYGNPNSSSTSKTLSTSGTLEQVLNYLIRYFKNVNVTVNGEYIAYVGGAPTYPIVIPGQLTIYNNQPLEYSFPADTYIDLPDLTNIIRNAINSSGVVMWSDIADTYVDVNGQTAVAVTKIVRNDYDNLYYEQYPYPAMLIGMTDNTKFNEHLLDNSQGYLSPMVDVVDETVSVLPAEIVGVLAIGAILTIFAVIINRLLE